ncbi:quinone oxidoreductase [Methylobacterium sp. Leaf456]|uniref:quinone oxidoreductase family protein n=1 Tax=Methylobacterium sp. Leaf456 TaxID=1736382 RepID=UPI0006FC06F8|nr:quinone oxidoreductase [Methylobacterium sp. Leaf456]KQT58467.1 quinone oxidoreductase [Methylobacterium sp. Leaf456]
MSRAVLLREHGGPEVLRVEEVAVGAPGPGEIRLRQTAIGVNFHDCYVRSGLYRTLPLPGVPGIEAVGHVEALGEGVEGLRVGSRVGYVSPGYGAYAETRRLPASLAVPLPDDLGDEAAASVLLKGLTACMLLRRVHRVSPGETILVHAAAGGVGQLLCAWAKHLGATVIGTVGSREKAEIATRAGADHVVLYREEDFVPRVREITEGRGVAAAYDAVGRDTFLGSLDCLGFLGTLVNYGQASGPVEPISPSALAAKSNALVRPIVFHHLRERAALGAMAGELFAAIAAGIVRPETFLALPLEDVGESHRTLEARRTTGSVILIP